jgi:hypothetical protein
MPPPKGQVLWPKTCYPEAMAVTWADSASKHGIAHEDAVHALTHFIYQERAFEAARPPATVAPDLYIGPQRSRAVPLLEVMLERRPPSGLWIFHVMELRPAFRARMNAARIAQRGRP